MMMMMMLTYISKIRIQLYKMCSSIPQTKSFQSIFLKVFAKGMPVCSVYGNQKTNNNFANNNSNQERKGIHRVKSYSL